MQFVAEDPVHVVIRNASAPLIDAASGGIVREAKRRLSAKFARGTAPSWALAVGLKTFEFRKRPQGVTPEQWLSFYDSIEAQQAQGWTDEEREAIEAKLLISDGVVLVERPRLSPPWPAYSKLVAGKKPLPSRIEIAKKIAAKVLEDGYSPSDVLAYELENAERPEVITALQELLPAGTPARAQDAEEELIEA